MDLFGPNHYSAVTNDASLYGFVIVDDYSRYTWVHLVTYKHEVQEFFKRFSSRASTNFDVKIKHIRSDNGTEFKNSGLDDYLDELGITHELSAPYTPQQNGVVERKNRTLVEMARTMLDEYKTLIVFGLMQLILRATSSTEYIFTNSSRRRPMNSSLTRNPM